MKYYFVNKIIETIIVDYYNLKVKWDQMHHKLINTFELIQDQILSDAECDVYI